MARRLTLEMLVEAVLAGGPSSVVVSTELRPAAGWHAAIAPAVFPGPGRNSPPQYAFQRRFLDGELRHVVLVDGKASQLNRVEAAQQRAIEEGDQLLERVPRIVVSYEREWGVEEYSDLTLPHRAFDGHIRAGRLDGVPVTQAEEYRALRNATPRNARALLETSPATLVYGGWDSTRKTRQGRWPSAVVGEIVGFCADGRPEFSGGGRVDPVAAQVKPSKAGLQGLLDEQKAELGPRSISSVNTELAKKHPDSASPLGLGNVPPSLGTLAGVACDRIIRSQVLSFATLRQIRFGAGPEGDAACRALLAAFALDGLARANGELYLRANCHLEEAGEPSVRWDARNGADVELEWLTPEAASALLAQALERAEAAAGVRWNGVAMRIQGNPDVVVAAVDDAEEEATA